MVKYKNDDEAILNEIKKFIDEGEKENTINYKREIIFIYHV